MKELLNLQISSHQRLNILTNEWVLVSPHRMKRPWQGRSENQTKLEKVKHDTNCYLCPGNERINGDKNPHYSGAHVFDNDFAALQTSVDTAYWNDGLLQAKGESGICRVICYSPDHSKTMSQLSISELVQVVDVWADQYISLSQNPEIHYVQIFENKGEIMGCSNPHPHGQIWSQSSIPNQALKMDQQQLSYFRSHGKLLLLQYVEEEMNHKERLVYENENFAILVPFWAIWPYETIIVPKRHQENISKMSAAQKSHFAEALSLLTKVYDQLFACEFPYSSGIYQAPTTDADHRHWHWHMSFYPPLLRSATVKKFMVGYEMFASPQRDLTPEVAAQNLRLLL
jgi:UDPglucose--hexose-1-phosphate uridylyltransferase